MSPAVLQGDLKIRKPFPSGPDHDAHRVAFAARRRHGMVLMGAVLFLLGTASSACSQRSTDFSLSYTQERAAFVGAAADRYFYLRGATADVGYTFFRGIGLAVSGTGLAATNLRGSIDIHHVQALVGPRYTYNWGHITNTHTSRKGSAFVDGKIGYTLATAGQYPYDDVLDQRASSLTYQGGGGLNLHMYHRFDLRLIEIHYVRTQLPNGGSNTQNTLRLASGINFHFGM